MAEYDGTPYGGDIIKAYRKKFAVDRMKAVAELQMLGVSLTKEQIDREKAAVTCFSLNNRTINQHWQAMDNDILYEYRYPRSGSLRRLAMLVGDHKSV